MIESQTMKIGETRKIIISVSSIRKQAFEVENASYKLYCGSEVEAEGSCEITEVRPTEIWISALINPKRVHAVYKLEYTYSILPETLKYVCEIRTVR